MRQDTTASLSAGSGASDEATLARAIAGQGLRAVFQPVVDLASADVVAYEALARGPLGSALERPDRLFAAARSAGRLTELDWACRTAALEAVEAAGVATGTTVLVNVEPETLGAPQPAVAEAVMNRAERTLRPFVEITERAITARPAELLAAVGRMRERGYGVAIDDVGADPRSLALIPLLRPDLIKLDLRLVQQNPSLEVASIVSAVNAESERTGASVLAEGIETSEHLALARSMGATLGQGWLFGRPENLRPGAATAGIPRVPMSPPATVSSSPCSIAAARTPLRTATKPLLQAISLHLERQASLLGSHGIILGAFEHERYFTAWTARRYERLAADAGFVAAFGQDLEPEPAPGVRGADLAVGDAVVTEWDVVVLSPHFAGALVARDLGDTGPEATRRFDHAVTYDRDTVVAVAQSLLARVQPTG